jgi:predicted signal transduction protein with EAL and GGDEF domain
MHVLLDLFNGQAFGIKAAARWHGCDAYKRPVLFDQIEARAIDPQIVTQLLVLRALAGCQRLVERQRLGIDLPPVDILQVA